MASKLKCIEIPKFEHERFFKFIKINGECWNWCGYISHGYGKFYINRREFNAHRVSYDIFIGFNKLDTVIDHICMNKKCVNPDHLREVEIRTNTLENSNCDAVLKSKQTHCKNGHRFTIDNTIVSYGKQGGLRRNCRTCSDNTKREWYKRNKESLKNTSKVYYLKNKETIKKRSHDRYHGLKNEQTMD